MSKGICPECGLEKQLTQKGFCWKCQVGSLSTGKKCKGCRPTSDFIAEHRTSQNITTTVTPFIKGE